MSLSEKARVEVYLPDLPKHTGELQRAAFEALEEEAILVVVLTVYHSE